MQVLKHRNDEAVFRNPNNEMNCIVLDELQAVNKRLAAAIEKRVKVIDKRGNKCVDKRFTGFIGEEATDLGYISKVID